MNQRHDRQSYDPDGPSDPQNVLAHWTTPPSDDDGLSWYFNQAESALGVRSISEAMEAMALAGINGGGTVQTDDRLVRRGIVGVATADRGDVDSHIEHRQKTLRDRESAAGKFRRIDNHLMQMTALDRAVLALAYGASGCVGQVKQIIAGPQFKAKLGHFCGVALLTKKAREMPPIDFDAWVRNKQTSPAALNTVKQEALHMLKVAWNRFADLRGRRRRFDTVKA